jgi:hypothetical protein
VSGNYLYIGSGTPKNPVLLVFDVSNPASPRKFASVPLAGVPYGITAQPGWISVAMGTAGLANYSAAGPASPALIYKQPGAFWGLASAGNLLYAASDFLGLMIFDMTKPDKPTMVSQTGLGTGDELIDEYYPYALSVSLDPRGIAWLCTPKDGRVYGLDVRAPLQPRHIAEFTTEVGAYLAQAAAVSNGLLIVAGNDAAFDVSVPQNVGLYDFRQTFPGAVLPDRLNDEPPVSHAAARHSAPPKSRETRHPRRLGEGIAR